VGDHLLHVDVQRVERLLGLVYLGLVGRVAPNGLESVARLGQRRQWGQREVSAIAVGRVAERLRSPGRYDLLRGDAYREELPHSRLATPFGLVGVELRRGRALPLSERAELGDVLAGGTEPLRVGEELHGLPVGPIRVGGLGLGGEAMAQTMAAASATMMGRGPPRSFDLAGSRPSTRPSGARSEAPSRCKRGANGGPRGRQASGRGSKKPEKSTSRPAR